MSSARIHGSLTAAMTCLLLAACSDPGGPPPPSSASPKAQCEALNDAQRAATALENALSAATSNDQAPGLLDQAAELNSDLSSALASGAFVGKPVNDDLQAAIRAVQTIENDLNKPNVAQASLDAGALKNAMIQLGEDCSPYLS